MDKQELVTLGVHQHQVSCIIGVYAEERQREQILFFDAKIKLNLSLKGMKDQVEETVDYVKIADVCTRLAKSNRYFLLEKLASDIIEEFFLIFPAVWASITIKKPAAIPFADYAFIELERKK